MNKRNWCLMASTAVFQTVSLGSSPRFRSMLFLTIFMFIGCAGNSPNRIEADNRLQMNREDREYQAKAFGYFGFRPSVKVRQAFLDGWVIEGMKESMVFDLYGEPDEIITYSEFRKDWIYNNSSGYEMSRIAFVGSVVAHTTGHIGFRRQAP